MKGSLYTLVYAAVLGSTCALLLTAAADFTADYEKDNRKAEENLNKLLTLKVVPLQAETSFKQLVEIYEKISSKELEDMYEKTSSKQLVEIYDENVHEQERGDITTYVYSPPQAKGKPLAIAMRFSGHGLWGPIKGFLALEPDMKTIRGITFYEQEETPGLGGEIVSSWFREQFVGKSIVDESGKVGIIIRRKSGKQARNEVDAITGATMTCNKVEAMLNAVIKDIVEEYGKSGK